MNKTILFLCLGAAIASLSSCSIITAPYHAAKGVVEGGVWVVKTTYEVTAGTTKIIYRIGEYTYEVVKAPVEWALTHEEIESIDGLPVKEAIRQGRVKTAPYVVIGRRYVPMSPEKVKNYSQEGIASWYGYESGKMTANGEVFNPNSLSAAHKYFSGTNFQPEHALTVLSMTYNLKLDFTLFVKKNAFTRYMQIPIL